MRLRKPALESRRTRSGAYDPVHRYEIEDHRAALHWIAQNDRDAMTAFIEAYVAKNHKEALIAGVKRWTKGGILMDSQKIIETFERIEEEGGGFAFADAMHVLKLTARLDIRNRPGAISDRSLDDGRRGLMPYKVHSPACVSAYAHQLVDAAPDYAIVTIAGGDGRWTKTQRCGRCSPTLRWLGPRAGSGRQRPGVRLPCSLGHQVQFARRAGRSRAFPLGFRSSKLNKQQMSDLIEVIYEYGSTPQR